MRSAAPPAPVCRGPEYVRFHQHLARLALAHEQLGAACVALRGLHPEEFQDPWSALVLLCTLRDRYRQGDLTTRRAAEALVLLAPAEP